MIYFPDSRPLEQCPLPDNVSLWHAGAEQGLLAGAGNPNLLVFFHGNADSACDWRYLGVNHLHRLGYDVLVVEYPGYRGDPRPPSKDNIEDTVIATGNWVAGQGYAETVVMGYSLGTGAASLYAGQFDVQQVILFAPFDSVYNVAWAQGFWFPRLLLREDFDNMAALASVDARIDIRHGLADAVIPASHSENLMRALVETGHEVHRQTLPATGHHRLFEVPAFDAYLDDILQ